MTDTYRILGLAGRGAVASVDGSEQFEPFLVDLELGADGEPDLPGLAQAAAESLGWPAASLTARAQAVASAVLDAGATWVSVTVHQPEVALG
ncbi:hypothetical protein, partial [Miniimonas arenae]|uniref:hypothetical protein n=2 Tax=Miniimonas TaxID=947525 RepID=UPI0028AAF37D